MSWQNSVGVPEQVPMLLLFPLQLKEADLRKEWEMTNLPYHKRGVPAIRWQNTQDNKQQKHANGQEHKQPRNGLGAHMFIASRATVVIAGSADRG